MKILETIMEEMVSLNNAVIQNNKKIAVAEREIFEGRAWVAQWGGCGESSYKFHMRRIEAEKQIKDGEATLKEALPKKEQSDKDFWLITKEYGRMERRLQNEEIQPNYDFDIEMIERDIATLKQNALLPKSDCETPKERAKWYGELLDVILRKKGRIASICSDILNESEAYVDAMAPIIKLSSLKFEIAKEVTALEKALARTKTQNKRTALEEQLREANAKLDSKCAETKKAILVLNTCKEQILKNEKEKILKKMREELWKK